MARARGCDLRAVLAGMIICWAVAVGVAVGQEGAEVTEDLGNSYVLARRTTSQGSLIETLLFAGQAIVTEIVVPAGSEGSVTAGTTGAAAVARAASGTANAARSDAANLPLGMGLGFGGTLLTGEIVDDYLVLHRTRANGAVTHEIFREGHKVGIVTEVDSSARAKRSPGRNSFAFESTDDRFIVHLTQPDGTRIRATTEHGRFSGQVVERVAAIAAPPRSAAAIPPSQPLESLRPSMGRAPEPQRLAIPREPAGRIMEEPTPQVVPALPEAVPLPRAFPKPRLRPAIAAIPVQTGSPVPPGNSGNAPAPTAAAPAARPKPPVASVSAPSPTAPPAAARPVASAPTAAAPTARPKPAVASVSTPPPAAARSVASAPTPAAPLTRPKPPAASVNAFAPAGARPVASAPTPATPLTRPKPAVAAATTTANARPSPAVATKPVPPVAKPSRPLPSSQ